MKTTTKNTTNELFTLEVITTESGKKATALIPTDKSKKLNSEAFNRLRNLVLSEGGFSFGKFLENHNMRPMCIMKLTELQIERLLEGFTTNDLEEIKPKNKKEPAKTPTKSKEDLKAEIETKKPAKTTNINNDTSKAAQITALKDLFKEGIIDKNDLLQLLKDLK